jgi:hypothetical protein
MTLPEILSIASSLFGIVFSPLGAYLAYKSYKKASSAVEGSNELARRMTSRSLYMPNGDVRVDTQ